MTDEEGAKPESTIDTVGPTDSEGKSVTAKQKRVRSARSFPANTFEDVEAYASAINKLDPDGKIKRLTLFKQLNRSPESGPSRELITSSNKYGVTEGGAAADDIALTSVGREMFSNDPRVRKLARFTAALNTINVFKALYDQYKGKRLADRSVLADAAVDKGVPKQAAIECIDLFLLNARFIGLVDTIAGAETLLPVEMTLDSTPSGPIESSSESLRGGIISNSTARNWEKTCFYITPIGEEGTEQRKHSDLFLGQVVVPALEELGLEVIRADHIGEAGLITAQVLEFVVKSRLVVADLSWYNPNAYYELAVRHACRKPFVQICRKADRLPFDVGQTRTIILDTSDLYSFVPQLQSYRAEIAAHARAAINNSEPVQNPLTVFLPNFEFVMRA